MLARLEQAARKPGAAPGRRAPSSCGAPSGGVFVNSQADIWITLRVVADELAQKQFGDSWEGQRNAFLSKVFAAAWLGQFEDASKQVCLKSNCTHQHGSKPEPTTREELLRRFPMGEPWVPKEVRDHAPPKSRHTAMSRLLWDDYPEGYRREMQNIMVSRAAFEAWAVGTTNNRADRRLEKSDVANNGPADQYKTGLAGRPTIKHHILAKLRRRAEAGETADTNKEEAEALREWAAKKHPEAPTPAQGTTQNHIRIAFKKLKTTKPTK